MLHRRFVHTKQRAKKAALCTIKIRPRTSGSERSWKTPQSRRLFLDSIREQLGGTYEALQQISYQDIRRYGGRRLSSYFNESSLRGIIQEYPEHAWKLWKFKKAPKRWWQSLGEAFAKGDCVAEATVRNFMDDLSVERNITKLDDWYNECSKRMNAVDCIRFTSLGSLPTVLQRLFPFHPWNFTKRQLQINSPKSDAGSLNLVGDYTADRRKILDALAVKLGGNLESLYGITSLELLKIDPIGMQNLLEMYNHSTNLIFQVEYPEHHWHFWRFTVTSRGLIHQLAYLSQHGDPVAITCIREFIQTIAEAHKVSSLDKWYSVTMGSLSPTLKRYLYILGGLKEVLKLLYPDHEWKFKRVQAKKKQTQRAVNSVVRVILPREHVNSTVPLDAGVLKEFKPQVTLKPHR